MSFSIRWLFALILVVGPALGISLSHGRFGVWLSVAYAAITGCLLFLAFRTFKTWQTVNALRRVYGTLLSTLCLVLWLLLVANIVNNPSIHRARVAADLNSTLRRDKRFESVEVEYVELKPKYLRITGTLESESDFNLLRKMISDRNWKRLDGVHWLVRIQSTHRELDEWDGDF